MRNENGVWCDIGGLKGCTNEAVWIHSCKIEGSEFAFCSKHEREWRGKTRGKNEQMVRCPRCLPQYLLNNRETDGNSPLPNPITGPLAVAFDEAMYREGVLAPTRIKALQRLAQISAENSYLASIFRTTANVPADISEQNAQNKQNQQAS